VRRRGKIEMGTTVLQMRIMDLPLLPGDHPVDWSIDQDLEL
jgi:hypothetical protein